MSDKSSSLDEMDLGILQILQQDCRTPLEDIANKLGAPKSTIHYRVKRLEEEGIISGYHARLDPEKLGRDYVTVTLVRARYGKGYDETVGKKISEIPGVWAVYFIFGENDFIILTRSKNREDYVKKLERMMGMMEIERTSTQVVAKIVKEDTRMDL